MLALGYREVNRQSFEQTLGSVLKSESDISQARLEAVEYFK
jgi:hypothetical protein